MLASVLVASSLLLPAASVRGLVSRQQQDANSPLYLNEPSCDSYQCSITWKPGQNATANWLNAPDGNVVLDLMTNASSVVAHNIGTVPGVTSNCDAGQGAGVAVAGTTCGSASFIVATEWVGGNYTLRAMSQNQPSIESYTDVILVVADPANTASVAFSLEGATATATSNGTSASSSVAGSSPSAGSSSSSSKSGANPTTAAPTTSKSSSADAAIASLRSHDTALVVASTLAAAVFASVFVIL
ncbi:hypothetical protein FA10DRAFT_260382 [Acaromyces ingoldii]|uniref:Uncharacterized protein n=1 Tax=Acaromyces ingoldii TaxID=215250 RepID=A0A316YLZ2_9BASI|nr:hypothetical protein FA10DRAFT_260382 [Acaromyces ingoldii]PWN90570.1 hypothetical protein FA10DRAFT_260382 [Acaromyces ingoldii]